MQVDIFVLDFQPVDFKSIGNFRVKLRGNAQNTLRSGGLTLPGQFPVIIADLIDSNFKAGIVAEFFNIVARWICLVCFVFANCLVQEIHTGILGIDFYFLFENIFFAGNDRIKFLLIAILPKNIIANRTILFRIIPRARRVIQRKF